MEVRILNKEGNNLELEIIGEGHTFCNLLVDFLNSYPEVEYAGYDIPHPLLGAPKLFIRVKKGDPEELLKRALRDIIKLMDELSRSFEVALKSVKRK
ncbi:MAG: DNA-directed RNA polymerase subunit L [Thermofilum sp. ex4484_15]|nr:MAG: DNA-directed RNA polymerase subunit L [Thermofilum sp. ex4484_15]